MLCCPGGAARCSPAVVVVLPFFERLTSDPEFRVILRCEVPPATFCLTSDAAAAFPVHSCPVLPDPFVITRLWFGGLLIYFAADPVFFIGVLRNLVNPTACTFFSEFGVTIGVPPRLVLGFIVPAIIAIVGLLLVVSGIEGAVGVVLLPLLKCFAADPEFRIVFGVLVDPTAVAL